MDSIASCPQHVVVVLYHSLYRWSKSGSPKALERTAHVFSRMCDMYKSGNQEARPNFVSFVTLIDAIVKNGDRGAAQRAEDVLKQMYAQYEDGNDSVKPNSRLITSVMDCWARSGARNAGEKAEALLDWMIEAYADEEDASYKPNEITFNTGKLNHGTATWLSSRSRLTQCSYFPISNQCMVQVARVWQSLSGQDGAAKND